MDIEMYLNTNLSYSQIKAFIQHTQLAFIKSIQTKGGLLEIQCKSCNIYISSKTSDVNYAVSYLDDTDVFLESKLIEGLKIKPMTFINMFCSNDLKGYDECCAFVGFIWNCTHADFIAILEETENEEFAKKSDQVVISYDIHDLPQYSLYKRLLDGNLDGYSNIT